MEGAIEKLLMAEELSTDTTELLKGKAHIGIKTKIKNLKKLLNQIQWYVTRDRGATFNPIFEGGFETKLEAQMYLRVLGDQVIAIRNKNLASYIKHNWDLRGELRRFDGAWRRLDW